VPMRASLAQRLALSLASRDLRALLCAISLARTQAPAHGYTRAPIGLVCVGLRRNSRRMRFRRAPLALAHTSTQTHSGRGSERASEQTKFQQLVSIVATQRSLPPPLVRQRRRPEGSESAYRAAASVDVALRSVGSSPPIGLMAALVGQRQHMTGFAHSWQPSVWQRSLATPLGRQRHWQQQQWWRQWQQRQQRQQQRENGPLREEREARGQSQWRLARLASFWGSARTVEAAGIVVVVGGVCLLCRPVRAGRVRAPFVRAADAREGHTGSPHASGSSPAAILRFEPRDPNLVVALPGGGGGSGARIALQCGPQPARRQRGESAHKRTAACVAGTARALGGAAPSVWPPLTGAPCDALCPYLMATPLANPMDARPASHFGLR